MHLVRPQLIRRGIPPLPPATMVIDMRGEGGEVISMLEGEIRNLTEEMKQQNIHLWSSLANFISFNALGPMEDNDSLALSPLSTQYPIQQNSTESLVDEITADNDTHNSTEQLDQINVSASEDQMVDKSQSEEKEAEAIPLHLSFAELPDKIDRLRNARINALSNLGTDGTAGNNLKEEVARVIFLADARHVSSLSSTAACAKHLKDYYRKYERRNEFTGKQSLINISVLCLNHETIDQNAPPTRLIEGLSPNGDWKHLDALILSETYRRDMAQIDQTVQNLFAELLLYVLLLVSPALTKAYPSVTTELENELENTDKRGRRLPSNTYLVGLSSIENSTRWGYRLLNYGLAEKALQILRESNSDDEQDVQRMVECWLNDLQKQVRSALSEKLSGNISDLHALARSMNAALPAEEVFSNTQLSPKQAERSIDKVEQYLSDLTTTYTGPHGARSNSSLQQAQMQSAGDALPHSPTLENAVLSVPRIVDALDQGDSGVPETLLAQAQLSAYQVLTHRLLFRGPRGAIPRAKLQLKELARVIAEREEKRRQNPIDMRAKQEALQKSGQDQISELKKHVERWPFFAALLELKTPMAWTAAILMSFLCFVLVVLGFAWLEQLVGKYFPAVNRFLNTPLFGISAFIPFNLLLWLVLGGLIVISLFVFGRYLVDRNRSALAVESIFGIIVFVIAFSGLITWLSYGSATAPAARTILSWYPLTLLRWISIIAFFVALTLVIVENIFYFSFWKKELKNKREGVVGVIQREHWRSIEEVTTSIVDTLTLHLVTRAGLVNDQTGESPYYRRIDELNRLLKKTYSNVEDERRLAELRLGYGVDGTHLYLRQELLDVARLKSSYKRWRDAMDGQMKELVELSMMLLRTMGEEMPGNIERQFRDESSSVNSEPHNVRILTEMLTSVALRFSTAMPSSDMLTSLAERYEKLDRRVISQFSTLRPLIEALNKKVRGANLDQDDESPMSAARKEFDIFLATQALTAWGQMLWEKKDPDLNGVLAPGGVIARLIRDNHNPQTVKEELRIRTSPSGRSSSEGLYGGIYLFVASSPESRMFLKDVIPTNYVTDFPDPERLLLVSFQHYDAKPLDIE